MPPRTGGKLEREGRRGKSWTRSSELSRRAHPTFIVIKKPVPRLMHPENTTRLFEEHEHEGSLATQAVVHVGLLSVQVVERALRSRGLPNTEEGPMAGLSATGTSLFISLPRSLHWNIMRYWPAQTRSVEGRVADWTRTMSARQGSSSS